MGFDVLGTEPADERGKYFRNTGWWWHPLWACVADHCADILSEEDIRWGDSNDCHEISGEQAAGIGRRLLSKISEGRIADDGRYGEEGECFSVENVEEFAQFCLRSGGFVIT